MKGDGTMKEDLMLLAQLLAEDDEFALEFSSKRSIEDKHELAKTKGIICNKEEFADFVEMIDTLGKLAKKTQRLPLEELENVSGGLGKIGTKIAATAFLGASLTPFLTQNVTLAAGTAPGFYVGIASLPTQKNKLNKAFERIGISDAELQRRIRSDTVNNVSVKDAQINYYKSIGTYVHNRIYGQIRDLHSGAEGGKMNELKNKKINFSTSVLFSRKNDKVGNLKVALTAGDYNFKISPKVFEHIIFGDYDDMSVLKGGGHTKYARDLWKYINTQKLGTDASNQFRNLFKEIVLKGNDSIFIPRSTAANGMVRSYDYYDQYSCGKKDLPVKTLFPEDWEPERIINEARTIIQQGAWTVESELNDKDNGVIGTKYYATKSMDRGSWQIKVWFVVDNEGNIHLNSAYPEILRPDQQN